MKLVLLLLVGCSAAMLGRSAPLRKDMNLIARERKENFYIKLDIPLNFSTLENSKKFNLWEREKFVRYFEKNGLRSILYKRTDPATARRLNFNLAIHRQFQFSIFFSKTITSFFDGEWVCFLYKDYDILWRFGSSVEFFYMRLKQHFLSAIEAFRILELNRAVYGACEMLRPLTLSEKEIKIRAFSVSELYAPDYQSSKDSYEQSSATSSATNFINWEDGFFPPISSVRSHRVSLVSAMVNFLNLPMGETLPRRIKEAFSKTGARFNRLQSWAFSQQNDYYSWEDLREFVNNLGQKGILAELIDEEEKDEKWDEKSSSECRKISTSSSNSCLSF